MRKTQSNLNYIETKSLTGTFVQNYRKMLLILLFSVCALLSMNASNASTPLANSTIYVAEWSRLKHLAAEGIPDAQFQLGNMYYLPPKHSGIPKNFQRAFELFEQAAKQGHATAQHNLAVLFYRGEGVEIDRVKAIAWFMMAKDNGSISAAKHLQELQSEIDADIEQRVRVASKQITKEIQQAKTAK
jgi:hypothetical protein